MNETKPLHIYVVSDATGKTGWRVVQAALLQFDTSNVVIQRIGGIKDKEAVEEVINNASRTGGLIFHTLVSPELRSIMMDAGRSKNINTIDLLGPALTRLTESLQISPKAEPGLFTQLDDEYFARIDAIEFTVDHDDGRNPDDLDEADLVLVGVSRTGKTPLSVFLAYRGWRVANVPIINNLEPPSKLFAVDRRRVIALTIDPKRLVAVRQARFKRFIGTCEYGYASQQHIAEEMEWFRQVLRKGVWYVVDVTHRAIEESASEILDIVRIRPRI